MAFDLEKALRRKGEFESARLDAFHFRLRARTARLLAEAISAHGGRPLDSAAWARRVASAGDEEIFSEIRALAGESMSDEAWEDLIARTREAARAALIAEHGNPAPQRLA